MQLGNRRFNCLHCRLLNSVSNRLLELVLVELVKCGCKLTRVNPVLRLVDGVHLGFEHSSYGLVLRYIDFGAVVIDLLQAAGLLRREKHPVAVGGDDVPVVVVGAADVLVSGRERYGTFRHGAQEVVFLPVQVKLIFLKEFGVVLSGYLLETEVIVYCLRSEIHVSEEHFDVVLVHIEVLVNGAAFLLERVGADFPKHPRPFLAGFGRVARLEEAVEEAKGGVGYFEADRHCSVLALRAFGRLRGVYLVHFGVYGLSGQEQDVQAEHVVRRKQLVLVLCIFIHIGEHFVDLVFQGLFVNRH